MFISKHCIGQSLGNICISELTHMYEHRFCRVKLLKSIIRHTYDNMTTVAYVCRQRVYTSTRKIRVSSNSVCKPEPRYVARLLTSMKANNVQILEERDFAIMTELGIWKAASSGVAPSPRCT